MTNANTCLRCSLDIEPGDKHTLFGAPHCSTCANEVIEYVRSGRDLEFELEHASAFAGEVRGRVGPPPLPRLLHPCARCERRMSVLGLWCRTCERRLRWWRTSLWLGGLLALAAAVAEWIGGAG